jgi:hypothetical protein
MPKPTGSYCFVMMPFDPKFKNEWDFVLKPAVEQAGLSPYRGDDEGLGTNVIMHDVTELIYHAAAVVAFLADRNPNVMYELGLAHSAKKPVVVVARAEDEIPFDLKHIRYVTYDPKNLDAAREKVRERIAQTMRMDRTPDLFPELKLMTDQDVEALNYFRLTLPKLEIIAEPPEADIFFNDILLGQSPQRVTVNRERRNTISVAAIEHFEHHQEVSPADLALGKVIVRLTPRTESAVANRAIRLLRYWKSDPRNPVLGRAVCHYLYGIGEQEQAQLEGEDLLKVAPDWYLAHNQVGFIYIRVDPDRALQHFERARELRPKHYVGYYNSACVFAIQKNFDHCIEYLQKIIADEQILRAFHLSGQSLDKDSDFDAIRSDVRFTERFEEIAAKMRSNNTTPD